VPEPCAATTLVPRELRIEIAEQLDADGRVLVPLDEAAVARVAQALSAVGIEAVGVGFLRPTETTSMSAAPATSCAG
jgi:N-methylhydantoinase A/oxoprolinase/acetone carboxylase beta subunit